MGSLLCALVALYVNMRSLLCAVMALYINIPVLDDDEVNSDGQVPEEGLSSHGDQQNNGTPVPDRDNQPVQWFEEVLEPHLRWSFAINSVLHASASPYQDIALLDTKYFGKVAVLIIDGKMQSAEKDEFIYHEFLVHPALLLHQNPKMVFIMGGGEGSTAREALKHKTIEKVVMCDIDRVVVDFCRKYLTANQETFNNDKLHFVINDAKAELEKRSEKFDVIIGDLADPIDGGPCNHLYTKSFYEQVIKGKLNQGGIFITQAGTPGVLSHKAVFSPICNTLKQVFKYVTAYTARVPSYADSCGWVLSSDERIEFGAEEINKKIKERVGGELQYLDGETIVSSTVLNKVIRATLLNETHVFTEDDARYMHGYGVANSA